MEIKRREQGTLLDILKETKKIKKVQRYSHIINCRAKERVKGRFKDNDMRVPYR
jgi:hypothetical protein